MYLCPPTLICTEDRSVSPNMYIVCTYLIKRGLVAIPLTQILASPWHDHLVAICRRVSLYQFYLYGCSSSFFRNHFTDYVKRYLHFYFFCWDTKGGFTGFSEEFDNKFILFSFILANLLSIMPVYVCDAFTFTS